MQYDAPAVRNLRDRVLIGELIRIRTSICNFGGQNYATRVLDDAIQRIEELTAKRPAQLYVKFPSMGLPAPFDPTPNFDPFANGSTQPEPSRIQVLPNEPSHRRGWPFCYPRET